MFNGIEPGHGRLIGDHFVVNIEGWGFRPPIDLWFAFPTGSFVWLTQKGSLAQLSSVMTVEAGYFELPEIFANRVDGPWWPEERHTLWKKEDGQFRFPMGEPRALKLPGIHPRLNEVSPFIDNLTSHLEGTFKDPTSVGFRRYKPVISYWKKVKKQLECIQPLQDENLRGGFWHRTNHGTGFTLAQQHQETSRDGPEDDIIVIDELQKELRAENNLMMEPYVGDPANRPRRAFIPLEDITEGKFVILRLDDAFEVEIPRMIWLGRAMGLSCKN
ncbi:hypothetical protein R1sor_011933 [Riccia sorocarpa]|uniref:Uncharacterized protein n=1 Tax=Riccia sorocarpa TaxID=122646 RepID=A0ABD3I6B4_9MARC